MKIKVRNVDDKSIEMETSERGDFFSIAFHELNETRQDAKHWGHLNLRQARKLISELEHFVEWTYHKILLRQTLTMKKYYGIYDEDN